MLGRRLGRLAPVVLVLFAIGLASPVGAEGSISGPVVTLNHTKVSPGDRLVVTIDGFKAPSVTLSVCGNEGRRGSGDCNMVQSKGVRIDPAVSPTVTQFGVSSPPVGCPCIVRVSSQNNEEVAVVPITLIGHPIEPVVGGPSVDGPFVKVTVSARTASPGLLGWFRPSLGGPAKYEVTVTVKSLTTEPLHHVRVSGSVGRSSDDNLATLDLADPGEIGVGQTWEQTVSAVVPAPSLGNIEWRVAVSGAGPTVDATDTTRHRPVLLLALAMLLVVNVTILAMRFKIRRRLARDAARAAEGADGEATEATAPSNDDASDAEGRAQELVTSAS